MTRPLFYKMLIMSVLFLYLAGLAQAQPTYCPASGGCDEHISNVSVGTINNTSTCAGYQDFTNLSTIMMPGVTYPITITNGNPFYSDDQCGIWIDWNQNGNFLDDPPIYVMGSPGVGPYTATISVPLTALPGTTRMRVRILYTGSVDPCGSTTYGEVEDYTIIVPSLNPVDAGVYAIHEPLSPNSPGFQDIKATIMNFGTQPLTSVSIGWSVDGIIGTPYAWTGNLASLTTTGSITIGNVNLGLGTHLIKVWTSSPNNVQDPFTLNDTMQISVITCNLLTGNYTVGGTAADYPTITAAINAAASCGVSGPVTFNILPGSYNEQVNIPLIPGASQTNRISLQSSSGIPADVTLAYVSTSDMFNYTIRLDGADFFTLSGLTIQANGASYARAVVLENGADDNIIQGCIIQCNPLSATSWTSSGIYSGYTADHRNIIMGNTITHAYSGIYLNGDWSTWEEGNIVEGNIVQGFNNYGIYAYMQHGLAVRYNQVGNGTYNNWMNGIYLDMCEYTVQVVGNRVNMTGSGDFGGISLNYCVAADTVRGLIANNMVVVQSGSNSGRGISLQDGENLDFVYNSVRIQSQSPYSTAFNNASWGGFGNVFLNNIFSSFGQGTAVELGWGALSSISMMDYNDLYATGPNLAIFNGNITTLANWVMMTGLDSNSVSANPNFTTPWLLYPASAAINNKGFPIPAVFDDIDGNLRHPVTPDIGAVEFSPPNTDLAMMAWLSPSQSVCGLISAQPITVQVYNNGLNAQTGFSLKYSIDGGQTFSMPELVATTINPGDTLTFTFNQSANMSVVGTYHCLAIVSLTGDQNPINDTIQGIMITHIGSISSFPFIENFDNGESNYLGLQAGPNAGISINSPGGNPSYALVMTGGASSNWSGWSHSTTPFEAWELNTWHHASGLSCNINATGLNNLKLTLDLRMTYSYGPTYSYFRVLVNDTIQLQDLGGKTDFNPVTQSNDPFTTLEFDLSTFAGSTFTLRLQSALNYGPGTAGIYGDQAFIDNVMLFVPVPNDVGVSAMLSPADSACAGLSSPVNLVLKNFGTNTQTTFPVNVVVTNPDNTTQLINYTFTGSLLSNAQDTITVGNINTTASGQYTIKAYTSLTGDQANFNDTLTRVFFSIPPVDSFPWPESFDSFAYIPWSQGVFANGWTAANNSLWGFEMQVGQGSTPSSFTGPMGDHTTGNGLYVFAEASSGDFGDEAMLISPCLDLITLTAPELRFWYHMYGMAIGSLHVDVLQGGVWYNSIFSLTGQQQNSSAEPWQEAAISLSAYSALDKIRFRVVRGSSYEGDVCIDDVMIRQAPAKEAHLMDMMAPSGGCDLGLENVHVRIWNRGADTIHGNCLISYQIQGSAQVITEPMTAIIPPGDTGTYAFLTPINLTTPHDSVFTMISWVSLIGDTWNINDTIIAKINSNVSPAPPLVQNVSVVLGYPATLTVLNPDPFLTYSWYSTYASPTPLGTGVSFQTPPLTATTVYWVEAMYGSAFQTVTIGTGAFTSPYIPSYGYYDYNWSACVYSAQEINTSGSIDSIGFYVDNTVIYPMLGQKVWMSYFPDSVFVMPDKPNPAAMTQVFDGSITWTGPGWFMIPLTTSFNYNGNGNLMIYWENWDGSWVSGYPFYRTTLTVDFRAKHEYSDGSFPNYPGMLTNERPNIRLVGSGNGCPSIRVADTVFVTSPVVFVNAGNDISICQGDTTQLTVSATGGLTPYTYSWSPTVSLSNPGISNPLAFPQVNTTYSVTVTDQNSDYGTDDVIVTVKPLPQVGLNPFSNVNITSPPVQLIGGTPLGGTYSGPGVSGGYFYPSVAGGGTHTITYAYTSPSNGCTGLATASIYVDPIPGMDETRRQNAWSVYPNPSSGHVFVLLPSNKTEFVLELTDMQGRVIRLTDFKTVNDRVMLDLRMIPPGVYQLWIRKTEVTYPIKLILY